MLAPWKKSYDQARHLIQRTDLLEKSLMLGKIEGKRRRDEMVGRHHRLDGHQFEQTPGAGDGQGGLACCSLSSVSMNIFFMC